ncbi:nickel-type superoxide dismutase maturation protease [Streptomyces sp. TR06-5]|uniref:nickel-type superoxide dismutase maturation protease n=1 Tax=unclassified Streptomyces TaxID=2593676 RepID=UPI0039A09C4D
MPERAGSRTTRTAGEFPGPRGPLRRFGLAEVYNPSMLPTLRPGDRLVVHYGGRVRPGHVVVLRHPLQHDLLIVKRLVARHGAAGWWVQGDNPAVRNDSREFGAVPDAMVLARAWLRVRPRCPAPGRRQGSLLPLLTWALSAVRPLVPRPASRFRAR